MLYEVITDVGFPMFPFAKAFRMGPPQIASELAKLLGENGAAAGLGSAKAAGPYLNVFLAKGNLAGETLRAVTAAGSDYGKPGTFAGKRVMIEFSSPIV